MSDEVLVGTEKPRLKSGEVDSDLGLRESESQNREGNHIRRNYYWQIQQLNMFGGSMKFWLLEEEYLLSSDCQE